MDDLRAVVREARLRLMDVGPPHERSPGDFTRVSLPASDADVLAELLSSAGVRSAIEIGLAYGTSALAIAEALASHRDGVTHIVIDAYQELFDHVGLDVLATARLDGRYDFVGQESQLALPRMVSDGLAVDAAFVDGSHVFHNVFVDLYFLQRLVVPRGLLVLDDCSWPSVATAVDYFVVNMGWLAVDVSSSTRLRAFRLPDPPATPRFDEFQPFGTGRSGFVQRD